MRAFRFLILLTVFLNLAHANTDKLRVLLQEEIAQSYPGARIEISDIFALSTQDPFEAESVKIKSDNGKGEVHFTVSAKQGEVTGGALFSAFTKTWIAQRRILPGEQLNSNAFKIGEVNVAAGFNRELRGVILSASTPVDQLESKQTILEGSYPVTTALQKIPDVRRGDSIRIVLQSGDISLSTIGVAQEPAYIDGIVRVITQKTKRELVGKLRPGSVVEVSL